MERSATITNIYKLASCSPGNRFCVGLLRKKSSSMKSGEADIMGATVSSSVQQQVMALVYDKVLRSKKVDKLQELLTRPLNLKHPLKDRIFNIAGHEAQMQDSRFKFFMANLIIQIQRCPSSFNGSCACNSFH